MNTKETKKIYKGVEITYNNDRKYYEWRVRHNNSVSSSLGYNTSNSIKKTKEYINRALKCYNIKMFTPVHIGVYQLDGNRTLINKVKEAGIATYNPKGRYNGYGYEKLPLVASLENEKDVKKMKSILAEIEKNKEEKPKKKGKNQEEIIEAWAKRLSKLVEIDYEEAMNIAKEKIEYKEEKIAEVEERQTEHYSVKRQKLINKMYRENPLRRIIDECHARAIIAASDRHNYTDYEYLLEEGRELAMMGDIEKSEIKNYARKNKN